MVDEPDSIVLRYLRGFETRLDRIERRIDVVDS
jgi:hypothetical protein